MTSKGISTTIAMLLIAGSVQDVGLAQGANGYSPNHMTSMKRMASRYVFNRYSDHIGTGTIPRRKLETFRNGTVEAQVLSQRQRTSDENGFIAEKLNLEGYPRGMGIELKRLSD